MSHLTTNRIAPLDAARAFAALMGIILHTSAYYTQTHIAAWPLYGEKNSIFFDYLCCIVHLFRVPVFFFLAGFFAQQLLKKSNYYCFIVNRCKRIILPFIFFTLLVNYPVLISKIFKNEIHSFSDFISAAGNLSYLWFLEYLAIYYCFYLIIKVVLEYFNFKPTKFNSFISNRRIWLIILLINFFCLFFSKVWYTPTRLSVFPNSWLLFFYSSYFFLGTLLAAYRVPLIDFFNFSLTKCTLLIISFVLYVYLILGSYHTENIRLIAIMCYAIASYSLFSGFMVLCLKMFSKEFLWIRYLANASYWIYLSQIFFILVSHHYAVSYFDSIYLQYSFTCVVSLGLILLSYALLNKVVNGVSRASPLFKGAR